MHRCKHRIRASTAKKYRDTRVSEYPSSKTQRISRYACTPSSQKGGQAPRTRDATFGEKAERANRFAKSFAKVSSSRAREGDSRRDSARRRASLQVARFESLLIEEDREDLSRDKARRSVGWKEHARLHGRKADENPRDGNSENVRRRRSGTKRRDARIAIPVARFQVKEIRDEGKRGNQSGIYRIRGKGRRARSTKLITSSVD